MKKDQEYVEEYRKKFLEATGTMEEEGLQLYCSRCSEDDSFYDWLLTTLKEVREAERKRIRNNVKYKSIVALSNQGYQFAIAGDDLEQTLTTNN